MKYIHSKSNYDKHPTTLVKGFEKEAWRGYQAICDELSNKKSDNTTIVIDCYVGVDQDEIIKGLSSFFSIDNIIHSESVFYDKAVMNRMLSRYITDDRVFGYAYPGSWMDFIDQNKLNTVKKEVAELKGNTLIIGIGASNISHGNILILADMTIWEVQMRYRNEHISNFTADDSNEDPIKKYKRGYFVEWRLGNRQKQELYGCMDYYLDSVQHNDPKMITRNAFESGLIQMLHQPFRTVPFFDEGLWGGQWLKEVCDVEDKSKINYAWSYNLLFQENEVNLTFGDIPINISGYSVMQRFPKQLIGEKGFSRFGNEYPIRYDFLDTMEGGNLSLQVHPNTQYMQQNFGFTFTQDESYYFLDCAPEGSYMYLGLKTGVKREEMEDALVQAQNGGMPFDADRYTNKITIKKHDHCSIPAGTVHCSGKDAMVLEISSSPCIFTFKLWDWGRIGLDGKPRPINIKRGMENIQWDKQTDWIMNTCANKPTVIEKDQYHTEERTGLNYLEYLETRRIWMTSKTWYNTDNETNALCLVQGIEALIESPHHEFEPFIMHFAESICIPATIRNYTISPYGESAGEEIAVVKTYVRF